ncbi:hypothetical protein GYMLUDRAFT_238682 [Collybiopsis luxurians FD-317 M1]|nr:hypothetical protein GYMLUDRAFT_238682 [Collybiopsis luxurians FD-317 M1]
MDLSSDLSLEASGSRLLSESPIISSSHADLSISELSLSDRISSSSDKPFSLLARPSTPVQTRRSTADHDEEENPDDEAGEVTQKQIYADTDDAEDPEKHEQVERMRVKLREEKLQNDLFVLRKLNAAFSSFNEALEDVGSANEASTLRILSRISRQLVQTEGLLNKYMDILTKSEEFSRLIFDEEWEGADQDDMILQREFEERVERARKEAEERALAEQREKERVEKEAREKQAREERERLEREKAATRGTSSSGVRGVRGTRASNRGVRGAAPSTRGSTTSSRGQPSRATTASRSSGSARGTTRRGRET